jgi:thiol-disulfide isomerase/thioredoxin
MFLSTACVQKQPNNTNNNVSTTSASIQTPSYTSSAPTIVQADEPIINEPTTNNHNTSSMNGLTHQLPTIQGETITIIENGNVGFDFPQYRGKIIIFEIFGKDCEYCVEEMPIINRVKNEFSNRVKVIAIQGQDRMSPSRASSILRQHNINYPVIEGDDAKGILRFLADTYAWRGILPYILIIKDGSTEYTFPDGGVGHQELRESIQSLL